MMEACIFFKIQLFFFRILFALQSIGLGLLWDLGEAGHNGEKSVHNYRRQVRFETRGVGVGPRGGISAGLVVGSRYSLSGVGEMQWMTILWGGSKHL